jgi:gamma-glutamyl-gamma-aminobutyrate hydrolase PuuD
MNAVAITQRVSVVLALELCDPAGIAGLVLTGGNDLAALGGDAPERDTIENALPDFAERRKLPVLGPATLSSRPPLGVWAQPITGIMWHPERSAPFSPADVNLFRQIFGVE